tara:strand:- start:924 stop:1136 length:213 start_codon:yes stop_codon:yes gene_type:complete
MTKEDSWQQIAEREFREQMRLAKLEKDKRQRYFAKKRDKEIRDRFDRMMLKDLMLLATKHDISTKGLKLK